MRSERTVILSWSFDCSGVAVTWQNKEVSWGSRAQVALEFLDDFEIVLSKNN